MALFLNVGSPFLIESVKLIERREIKKKKQRKAYAVLEINRPSFKQL